MKTVSEYNKRIQAYRDEYVTATITRRQTIILQVKALVIAKELAEKRMEKQQTLNI